MTNQQVAEELARLQREEIQRKLDEANERAREMERRTKEKRNHRT